MKRFLFALVLLMGCQTWVYAEESDANAYAYFGFEPEIVTNYIAGRKKLGFVRVGVELMVKGKQDLENIEMHEPLLRAAIVEILGNQTEAQIKSMTGREAIRKDCLQTVNNLLRKEIGKEAVVNLLFTKYLYD